MSRFARKPSPSSRRDAVLSAAIELFRARGFHAVGIDDIGEAAGITGPGVYRHFPSKDSLLVAVFDEVTEQMLDCARTIGRQAGSPAQILEELVELHAAFAVQERSLLGVWVQDSRSLPREDLKRIRGRQREYMGEWARALAGLRPGLPAGDLETIAFAAVSAINSVAFHDSHLGPERLESLLRQAALAVLGTADAPCPDSAPPG